MVKVFPSILAADFSKLGEEIKKLETAGADGIHIDVMDGKFVDNITLGAPVIKSLRKCTKLFFDVHLMIVEPEKYIDDFVKAGADSITVHIEAVKDILKVIKRIKGYGIKSGISIKPNTEIPDNDILKEIDIILVMSVEPGFGGQKFIDSTLEKIRGLKKIKKEKNLKFEIEVDGGINTENSKKIIENGGEIIVAGSAIYNSTNKSEIINALK